MVSYPFPPLIKNTAFLITQYQLFEGSQNTSWTSSFHVAIQIAAFANGLKNVSLNNHVPIPSLLTLPIKVATIAGFVRAFAGFLANHYRDEAQNTPNHLDTFCDYFDKTAISLFKLSMSLSLSIFNSMVKPLP